MNQSCWEVHLPILRHFPADGPTPCAISSLLVGDITTNPNWPNTDQRAHIASNLTLLESPKSINRSRCRSPPFRRTCGRSILSHMHRRSGHPRTRHANVNYTYCVMHTVRCGTKMHLQQAAVNTTNLHRSKLIYKYTMAAVGSNEFGFRRYV